MAQKLNYTKAFEELKIIIEEVEKGEISVDELSEKINRAAELLKICKEKLSSTEENVEVILKQLEQ